MMAAQLKEPPKNYEFNNWLRWAIGIGVTILIYLTIHIGNEGSKLKKQMADFQAVQSTHAEAFRQTEKKIDRIEDKIDKLIERK